MARCSPEDNRLCLSVADAAALGVYFGEVAEVRDSLARCPYVTYVD